MSNPKKYVLSGEAYKYPYYAIPNQNETYLSEKICCYTIKIRKKIVKKTKRVVVYVQLIISLGNGLNPAQAIGLPILPTNIAIKKVYPSNVGLSKKSIIAQVSQEMPTGLNFTTKEMDQLYNLGIKLRNNSLSQEQLINKISNLRGGAYVDIYGALGIILAIIILASNDWSFAFQPNPNAIVPPHLQWLYGPTKPGNQFGYGKHNGPRSLTVTGLAQNAGSDKKDPSSGSYEYNDVMNALNKQSPKKIIDIQIGNDFYKFKNPYPCINGAIELEEPLAEKIYDSIRNSDTDISDIAKNLGLKADNIKKVKDHIFYNEHTLDRFVDQEVEYRCFDPNLSQALAWKRLEAGIHTPEDRIWIKHEYCERHHELKYESGYSEAHERAEKRYPGYPWKKNFE